MTEFANIRHRFVWVAVVAVTVAVVALAVVSPAGATSAETAYGRPGAVNLFKVQGWWAWAGSTLKISGPAVYRAKGSSRRTRRLARRTQTICATYELYTFDASYYSKWRLDASPAWCLSIRPGYRFKGPAWSYDPTPTAAYSVNIVVTWRAAGKRLGKATYDYNRVADYACQTERCTTAIWAGDVAGIMLSY